MAKQFYPIDADLIKRIKFVIEKEHLTANKFAKEIGFSQGNLSDILNGKRPVPASLIDAICKTFDVDKQWLLTGEEQPKEELPADTMTLPLIPVGAMAGVLTGTSEAFMAYDCERYIVPIFKGADFLIRVQGDSMMPKYLSGDIVACKRITMDRLWFQWGKTYVLDTKQGPLIKRIEPSEKENCIKVCSYNADYKPFDLPTEEINALAVVTGCIKVE